MPIAIPPPLLKTTLGDELHRVASRLRAVRLHRLAVRRWLVIALLGFVIMELRTNFAEFAPYAYPALAVLLVAGVVQTITASRKEKYDYSEAARIVERKFPELRQALRTAAEQQPDKNGQYSFLQLRVIGTALQHANVNAWVQAPRRRAQWYFAGHAAALALALVFTAGPMVMLLANKNFPVPRITRPPMAITVTPGNVDIERGTPVVVAARFDGRLPRQTELVWTRADGKTGRVPMTRSLSDPIYAFSLPGVMDNTSYTVVHDGVPTATYVLKVYDRPSLLHANATLDYPAYTGQPKRTIPDTRRVSAITGTNLDYELVMNKPVKNASLQDEQGAEIPLTPANPERTRFTFSLKLEESKRLALRLTDNDGRNNSNPADFRIDVLPSVRPVVQMTFPQRDVRVSPIEEIHLQGRVRSQFNMSDYGLAYSIGAGDPQYVSLRPSGNTTPVLQANFTQTIDLESRGVEPGELVTWFAWADDTGPDGQTRRTTSDLSFAEVRPFETIYREDAMAGQQAQRQQQQRQPGQQGAGANPNEDLLELQRQISIAIWNLKQQDVMGANFTADVGVLHESQQQAIEMLSQAAENAASARAQAAVQDAEKFMKQAEQSLASAGEKKATAPLTPAWSAAQGAYQALLRMQSRDFRVAQMRQQQGQQGQQRQQRNQEQLNQLRFRQQQDRYQQENTAQEPTSQEQRDQMQAQSRLRELARRQQDLNQRLQELQTALAAAQDDQQREEIQRELRRLEEEQRNLLADLDSARQQLDNLQASQQNDRTRQQLEQARNDMRRAGEQLAQNQISQALASGTRAGQEVQQGEQAMRNESASRFAEQMQTARQEARDLDTRQEEAGRQLEQLSKGAAQSLDDSDQRQALAQTFTQQRADLDKLTQQLRQITDDSEATEPGLNRQLYDLLRQQARTTTAEDLRNGAQLLRNGVLNQAQPLQTNIAQNLDQLRQGVERAAASVLGNDTAALRFAQNELSDLTQQMLRESPTSEQFRTDPNQPQTAQAGPQGESGQQFASGNQTAQNGQQGQPGQTGGQAGAQGGQLAQNDASNQFRQGQQGNGQNGQPGQQGQGGQQPGENGQGQGAQAGQQGQPGDQFASNDQPGQGQQAGQNGQQPGQGGQPGNRQGGGAGQQGQQGQGVLGGIFGNGQSQQQSLAQNGQGQQQGRGQGQGQGQGQAGQRGQGQGRQGRGQQPSLGDGGQLAQNDQQGQGQQGGQGQANGQGRRGGGRGGRGAGNAQGGNQGGDQLAQNGQPGDPNGDNPAQAGIGVGDDQFVLNDGQPNGQPGGRIGGRIGGGARGGNFNRGGVNGGGDYAYGGGAFVDNSGGGRDYVGPITGNFADWADRMRTVENLIDDPQMRQQVANALAQAAQMRQDFQRHSQPPQWDIVMSNVVTPLNNVRTQLRQELARREQPDALQPVDQDPVPDKYADSVKRYYEALGNNEPVKN